MADVVTDLGQLNGWFKYKYGPFFDNIPAVEKITSRLGRIRKSQQVGRGFLFPVELVLPQGVTYSRTGQGAFTINDAIAGESQEVTVDGSQIIVNDVLSYEAAAKAQSEGDEAFGDAAGRMMKRLQKSGHKRVELDMWYGQASWGQITSGTGATTNRVYVLSTASFAPGIWIAMKNATLDVIDSVTTPGNWYTSNAPMIVTAVNLAARSITVTGNATDLTAIDGAIAGGAFILPRGATSWTNSTTFVAWNSMVGVDKIAITNSGNLFGVSTTYELFQGNTFDVGSTQLTLKKIYDGVSDASAKLGEEVDLDVFTSFKTFNGLASDQASLRRYGAEVKNAENGAKEITFFGLSGKLKVIPYSIVKEGEAYALPLDRFMKVGAMDLGFNVPGRGEQFFENVPTKAGYRLQMYASLAIVTGTPGGVTKFTNIVNQ